MKNNFRGWTSVYGFTFKQSVKGMGFKIITILVALLIFAGLVVMNVVVAKPNKNKSMEISPIKRVYVLDNSGLKPADYKEVISQSGEKQFQDIEFVTVNGQSEENVIKTAAADSSETIAVIITMNKSGYELKGVIPENSKITKSQAEALIGTMSSAFESNKLLQAGLSEKQLVSVLKPAVVSLSEIGVKTNAAAEAIKIAAPMVFSFMLYFMLLLYGQTISKSISTEKTSKLMETLLTSVHPYALITGKVLAITTMALGQFITWIAAGAAGLYGGNAIAHTFYPQYQNSAITIINFLKDNIGKTALTPTAVLLAVIFFCVGFIFYCIIAAVAGSMVSKPEDAASTQAIFMFPVIISWLVSYFVPLAGNNGVMTVLKYIPFTAPFTVPVDLITGIIGLTQGVISLALLMIFCLLTIILAARIYKGLLLYSGQKISFKMVGNVLKTNK